jgi:hypothetical protein
MTDNTNGSSNGNDGNSGSNGNGSSATTTAVAAAAAPGEKRSRIFYGSLEGEVERLTKKSRTTTTSDTNTSDTSLVLPPPTVNLPPGGIVQVISCIQSFNTYRWLLLSC